MPSQCYSIFLDNLSEFCYLKLISNYTKLIWTHRGLSLVLIYFNLLCIICFKVMPFYLHLIEFTFNAFQESILWYLLLPQPGMVLSLPLPSPLTFYPLKFLYFEAQLQSCFNYSFHPDIRYPPNGCLYNIWSCMSHFYSLTVPSKVLCILKW